MVVLWLLLLCCLVLCLLAEWLQPHFAASAMFDCDRWSCRVTQLIRCTPLWPGSWLTALDKSRGSKSVEVLRGSGRFMMIGCGLCLVLIVMGLPVRFWMMMFLLLGLFGRLLLRLLWLMLTVFLGGRRARYSCPWCGGPICAVVPARIDESDWCRHIFRESNKAADTHMLIG